MRTPEDEPRLDDMVGYHLRRASAADMSGATNALEVTGLRTVPASVLMTIDENDGPSSADLCRLLGMQRANMAPVLAELERRDLVMRSADPNDNRIMHLYLTPGGVAETRRLRKILGQHERRFLAPLSVREQDELRRLLKKAWQHRQRD